MAARDETLAAALAAVGALMTVLAGDGKRDKGLMSRVVYGQRHVYTCNRGLSTSYLDVVKLRHANAPALLVTARCATPGGEVQMQPKRTMLTCQQCGKQWAAYPSRLNARYCSRQCGRIAFAAVKRRPVAERLWDRVAVVNDDTSCWLWQGATAGKGYGVMAVGSKTDGTHRMAYVHRIALELQLGRSLGEGMNSLHKCDNPPCVRNDGERSHLFEGTTADNIHDMFAKGRAKPGGRVL